MMTKRFVQNSIINQIVENLESEGFRYKKSDGFISSSYDGGFDEIIIEIIDYWPVFQIEMNLRTRINVVDNIVNLFMVDCMNKDYMHLTTTTDISLKELSGWCGDYLEVETEEELGITIQKLISLIREKGFSFFEHHRDIVEVNNEKKKQILYEHYGLSLHHDRRTLMESIVLMELCNDPDLDVLVPIYLKYYVPMSGEEITGRKALTDLIEYLRNMKM